MLESKRPKNPHFFLEIIFCNFHIVNIKLKIISKQRQHKELRVFPITDSLPRGQQRDYTTKMDYIQSLIVFTKYYLYLRGQLALCVLFLDTLEWPIKCHNPQWPCLTAGIHSDVLWFLNHGTHKQEDMHLREHFISLQVVHGMIGESIYT